MNKNLLKKILIGLGGVLVLILMAIIITPLVVDIDQYRPQIVEAANEQINGELNIGKLSLSLWGQVEIDIDGITLKDNSGATLVSVSEAYAQIGLGSLLSGKPRLVLKLEKPDLNLVKDKSGKLNVLSLVKEAPASSPGKPAGAKPEEKSAAKTDSEIPGIAIIAAAGVDISVVNAHLKFVDMAAVFEQEVNDFNFLVEDLSMSRPMNLKIWADIDTKVGESIEVEGPIRVDGTIAPVFQGVEFKDVKIDLDMNFDDLNIEVAEVFHKERGVPANIKTSLQANSDRLNLMSGVIKFHNAELEMSALISKLQTVDPSVKLELRSKPIELAAWSQILTMLKEYELEGRMDINSKVSGPLSKINYDAKLDIQNLIAKTPGLIARPKLQMRMHVVTDQIKNFNLEVEAPGTDMKVSAKLKNFAAPQVSVKLNSNAIDLDQLLPKPEPVAAAGSSESKAPEQSSSSKNAPAAAQQATDVDKALDPVRNNEFIKSVGADVVVKVGKFKGMDLNAKNIYVNFSFKDLVANLKTFSLNTFNGLIKANAMVDIKPATPTYQMNLAVSQLDLKSAVESKLQSFKNTVIGRLNFKAQGSGRSFNSDAILKNLLLKGNFKVYDATFATIDVGRMAQEGVNKGIQDAAAKIPMLKDKTVGTPNNFKSRYKNISSGFSLEKGVFLAPNFATESFPKEGIDLSGRTQADLLNDKLDADWSLIDTYNLTKARDLSVEVSGTKVNRILAKGRNPVSFPVKAGCKLSAPCYDYAAVPRHLTSIALDNTRKAVKGRFKKETKKAKKKVQKQLKDKGKKKLEEQKNKLMKKFGF